MNQKLPDYLGDQIYFGILFCDTYREHCNNHKCDLKGVVESIIAELDFIRKIKLYNYLLNKVTEVKGTKDIDEAIIRNSMREYYKKEVLLPYLN